MLIHIDIINASTVCTDAQIKRYVAALQVQVSKHYYPIWNVDAYLTFIPKGHLPYKDHWWIAVLDNSDIAGALGYHDVTNEGLPLGKVFAQTDLQYGASISVTLSHELLEMLGDPDVNLTAQMGDGNFYAYENCDAVEADHLGYKIWEVLVSNFVHPSYFDYYENTTRYDQMNVLKDCCPAIADGGYMSYFDPKTDSWKQMYARTASSSEKVLHKKLAKRIRTRQLHEGERVKSKVKTR